MTDRQTEIQKVTAAREAVVWIDHARAIIVERDTSGHSVQVVDRLLAEREERFEARAITEVIDQDRVIVSGPAYARTGFERAYVALTHRPDRLVDVQPTIPTIPTIPTSEDKFRHECDVLETGEQHT